MVMSSILELLNFSRKVLSGLLMSRSWVCCLFTKFKIVLDYKVKGVEVECDVLILERNRIYFIVDLGNDYFYLLF